MKPTRKGAPEGLNGSFSLGKSAGCFLAIFLSKNSEFYSCNYFAVFGPFNRTFRFRAKNTLDRLTFRLPQILATVFCPRHMHYHQVPSTGTLRYYRRVDGNLGFLGGQKVNVHSVSTSPIRSPSLLTLRREWDRTCSYRTWRVLILQAFSATGGRHAAGDRYD
jgi:hypothetical protein